LGRQTFQLCCFFAHNPEQVFENLSKCKWDVQDLKNELSGITFLHTENLNSELHKYLLDNGFNRSEIDHILGIGKIFPPKGGRSDDNKWMDYYDKELLFYVKYKERVFLEIFPEYKIIQSDD